MPDDPTPSALDPWARFRFSVIGQLLADPPARGQLEAELTKLAERTWAHPITGERRRFGFSTIEAWYYEAREMPHPIEALKRRRRSDAGTFPAVGDAVREAIESQYRAHPTWTYQLHHHSLDALTKQDPPTIRPSELPSYTTLRRFMVASNWIRQRRTRKTRMLDGVDRDPLTSKREVRSYEAEHVGGLWHLDFHTGSLPVLDADGTWRKPVLFGALDDHSRLGCHLQWYFAETAENLVHGLCQAFAKRGLPRAILMDNGSAMIARETREGLLRLSIQQRTTLPESPYQNGKQESFWGQVEGRLLAQLEGYRDLTLAELNRFTQAWLERDYHTRVHSETDQTPLARFASGPSVLRSCTSAEELRLAFTVGGVRRQRRSDGTIALGGLRFELPGAYRPLTNVGVRYAHWDLSFVYLADPHSGAVLARIYPLDRAANADGQRKALAKPVRVSAPPVVMSRELPPLLARQLQEHERCGLPPAYLPKDDDSDPGAVCAGEVRP